MKSPTSRRDFFIQAARLTGLGSLGATLLGAVEQAASIAADPGTTFLDAEHVVILMQENRSFDHLYGSLRGVRGFDDPRAVTLPDQNPVWLQTNRAGETYGPFPLDIQGSNATWLGSLPHSWRDQTDARNHGNHDGWLEAKRSGRKVCAGMPFTLGFYQRADLPFYYALADAFTVCDQNFCSALTGTTPNRLFLWTGTIRDQQHAASPANVRNSDVDYRALARWKTFPERLEEAGISWKIYQNELSLPTGFDSEEDAWLANFTDNPIEWFEQYHVQFSPTFQTYARAAVERLPGEIAALAGQPEQSRKYQSKQRELTWLRDMLARATPEADAQRTPFQRRLHERAFTTNSGDPNYRRLEELHYDDAGTRRTLKAPAGDPLFQFRHDVAAGQLPAVSWLVPSERFSDHPGSPWYGAWMLSEVLNILTHKPEVWKKTVFILTYDENDGYFDHVPPFVVPEPGRPETGALSPSLDAAVEHWALARDRETKPAAEARGGPVGLGYRVPMVIASPWSRGGWVCSQVFDHTSVLQLLEKILSRKSGRPIRETNISAWRRAICGDLSSAFSPASSATAPLELPHPTRDAVLAGIHKAQFRELPKGYRLLSAKEVEQGRQNPRSLGLPRQEAGTRPSRALPYQLYAGGRLTPDRNAFELTFQASREFFGDRAAGAPFHVYTPGSFRGKPELRTRAYAVAAGEQVADVWQLAGFPGERYHLCCHGPNGFYREWKGDRTEPLLDVRCEYRRNGQLALTVVNPDRQHAARLTVTDVAYGARPRTQHLAPGAKATLVFGLDSSHGWYDLTLTLADSPQYLRRFAGRVETGRPSQSDPKIGSS